MSVRVRYFAAAAEAAGTDVEERPESSLTALRAAIVADHPALAGILDRCAVLVDGTRHDDDAPLHGVTPVDGLPPFAGGGAGRSASFAPHKRCSRTETRSARVYARGWRLCRLRAAIPRPLRAARVPFPTRRTPRAPPTLRPPGHHSAPTQARTPSRDRSSRPDPSRRSCHPPRPAASTRAGRS